MELLYVDGLIGEREADGILIVYLDVVDVEGDRGEISLEGPLGALPEGTAQLERTGESGMPGELAAEIRTPEGVEIELVHFECKGGRVIVAQLNIATHQ